VESKHLEEATQLQGTTDVRMEREALVKERCCVLKEG